MIKWTKARDLAAKREGWAIFLCDDGVQRIQKLDDPGAIPGLGYSEPRFESDSAAIAFVRRKARKGLKLHAVAMALHRKAAPRTNS